MFATLLIFCYFAPVTFLFLNNWVVEGYKEIMLLFLNRNIVLFYGS